MSTSLRLDRLLGRRVHTADDRPFGRIEEFRAEQRGDDWVVVAYVVGALGLIERLGGATRLLLGLERARGYVVRWDQMDLTHPDRPRLTCPIGDLDRP